MSSNNDDETLQNRNENLPVPGRRYPDDDPDNRRWAEILHDVLEELSANSIVSGSDRSELTPVDGQLFVPTNGSEGSLALGDGSSWNPVVLRVGEIITDDLKAGEVDIEGGEATLAEADIETLSTEELSGDIADGNAITGFGGGFTRDEDGRLVVAIDDFGDVEGLTLPVTQNIPLSNYDIEGPGNAGTPDDPLSSVHTEDATIGGDGPIEGVASYAIDSEGILQGFDHRFRTDVDAEGNNLKGLGDAEADSVEAVDVSSVMAYADSVDEFTGRGVANVEWTRDEIDERIHDQDVIIHDFEDVSMDAYSDDTDHYSIEPDSEAPTGAFSLRTGDEIDIGDRIVSDSGLNAYAPRGTTLGVYMISTGGQMRPGLIFGAADYDNHYTARVNRGSGEMEIGVRDDGEWSIIAAGDVSYNTSAWYEWIIDYGEETIRFYWLAMNGDVLNMIEVDDDTHDGYGVGFYEGSSNDGESRFDGLRRTQPPESEFSTTYDGGGGVVQI